MHDIPNQSRDDSTFCISGQSLHCWREFSQSFAFPETDNRYEWDMTSSQWKSWEWQHRLFWCFTIELKWGSFTPSFFIWMPLTVFHFAINNFYRWVLLNQVYKKLAFMIYNRAHWDSFEVQIGAKTA